MHCFHISTILKYLFYFSIVRNHTYTFVFATKPMRALESSDVATFGTTNIIFRFFAYCSLRFFFIMYQTEIFIFSFFF